MPKNNEITVEMVITAISQPAAGEGISLFERREQSVLPWKKEELLQLHAWRMEQDIRGFSKEKIQEYEQMRSAIDFCLMVLSDDILEYKIEQKRSALTAKIKKERKDASDIEDEITKELDQPQPSVEKISALMAKLTMYEPKLPYKTHQTSGDAKREYSLKQVLAEALSRNTSIRSVHLFSISSNDDLALLMADVLSKNRTIQTLDFAVGDITNTGAIAIAKALANNNTLTSLTLWHNKISISGGLALAAALKQNRALKTFNLFANETTYISAIKFAEAFKMHPALTNINLGLNDTGSKGAEAIMSSLSESDTCRSLGLRGANLGHAEEDYEYVAAFIEKHPSLTEMDLGKNKFGREGLERLLSAIQKNRNIEVLEVDGNPGLKVSSLGEEITTQLTANKQFKRNYRTSIALMLLLQSPLPEPVIQLMFSYLEPQNYYGGESDAQPFLDASKTAYRYRMQPSFFSSPSITSKPVPIDIPLLTGLFQGYNTWDISSDKGPILVINLDNLGTSFDQAHRIKVKLVIMLKEFFKLHSLAASAGLDSRTGFITITGATRATLESELVEMAAPATKSSVPPK